MPGEALGMIETLGLVGAIEAADAAMKAAASNLVDIEYADAGICTVMIQGTVADVMASVEAGAAAAGRVGQLLHRHVIPQPAEDTEKLIGHPPVFSPSTGGYDALKRPAESPADSPSGRKKKK